MDFLCLLLAGNLAGTNSPDGLVGNDDVLPHRWASQLLSNGTKLASDNSNCLATLTLLERLAAAKNDTDTALKSGLGLGGDKLVVFLEDHATLGVANEGPGDGRVFELVDGDLAGEGSVGLVEDILGSDLKAGAEVLAGEEEVERWWGNNNLLGIC
jgi:hypothetical protein